MKLRFKSVPVVSTTNVPSQGTNVQVRSYNLDGVREHELMITTSERFSRPAFIAACVGFGTLLLATIVETVLRKLDLSSGSVIPARLVTFAISGLAGFMAFIASVREETKFKMLMQALVDRKEGWRELRIVRSVDWEIFQASLQSADCIPRAHVSPSPLMVKSNSPAR